MRLHRVLTSVAALAVAGALVTGCDSAGGNSESAPTTTSALTPLGLEPEAPASYQPCTAVTQDIRDQLQLNATSEPYPSDYDGPGGLKWRGCTFVRVNGYAVGIRTTNITLQFVRENWSNGLRDFTIDGRNATSVHKSDEHGCTVNVEMRGGSLDFNLDNPVSNRDTGHLDSCQLATEVAELVVPTLPAGA
ncbi:DUF3558 domain-containing protein [Nocardia sp. NPDC051750]|uniref:DUF3558 domain-containing protein n=1 Tax=Nocardia sp. NPDC051750 TaxID=3364325 RepID=UPI00379C4500